MTATLESRKKLIVQSLADLNDEALIQQIENLIFPKIDFWDDLTEAQRLSIQKAWNQLEDGNRIAFSEIREKYKKNQPQ
jgi:hypothetical protein